MSSDGERLCENEAKTNRNGQEKEIHGDIIGMPGSSYTDGKMTPGLFSYITQYIFLKTAAGGGFPSFTAGSPV